MGNLRTLRGLLLLSSLVDPVFVAIDFERPQAIINRFQHGCLDTQVGLAILDTRCLSSTSKFTTFNFITGEGAYFEESVPIYRWVLQKKSLSRPCYQRSMTAFVSFEAGALFLLGMGFKWPCCVTSSWVWFPRKPGYCKIGYIPTCTRLANGTSYLEESAYGAERSEERRVGKECLE